MSRSLSDLVRRTPLMSLADKPHLACKMEACQTGGSFKMRGAVRTLQALASDGDDRQVITVSMGNTAFSLAWAGRLLDRPVSVVMPENVSPAKLALTRNIGAEVILHGQTGSEALAHCEQLVAGGDYYFLHPHKCPPFLAGSETIAREIVEDRPDTSRIYVPIGGGGLLSAICAAAESSSTEIEVLGVEAEQAPAFARSFQAGRPVAIAEMDTIADALTINEPDGEVFDYVASRTSRIVTVSEEEIVNAMRSLFDEFRVIAEPGGAASLAAMVKSDDGKNAAAIISGGNVSLDEFLQITGS
ncbi:MAG: pyridoxal-phosphate dependent enzyme [Alphaproteobacteria bacterium]|jgi:threonine dehydratase|nr:pyridoxal-phosphate dependent enzyme [Alphaproteobacteria bacterium]MBT4084383.1 pyridoxal-phosphate dependent enzyme [Alphaproteobacteria bacterium]MBT4545605.1 pyridoxal-phosphate dependent enzyme [Alphaproteobacteria bacterium]MBT7748062.1 pyridoxal-phosphate dependent enzyme [Alphaproteobacteria bacterium]